MNTKKEAECLVRRIRKEAKREAEMAMVAKLIYNSEILRKTAKDVLGLYPFLEQDVAWYMLLEEVICSMDELKYRQDSAYDNLNDLKRINAALDIRYALGIDCPALVPYNFD